MHLFWYSRVTHLPVVVRAGCALVIGYLVEHQCIFKGQIDAYLSVGRAELEGRRYILQIAVEGGELRRKRTLGSHMNSGIKLDLLAGRLVRHAVPYDLVYAFCEAGIGEQLQVS